MIVLSWGKYVNLLIEIVRWASDLFIGSRGVNLCHCALSNSYLLMFKCICLLIVSKNQITFTNCLLNASNRVDSFNTLSRKNFKESRINLKHGKHVFIILK